MSLERSLVETKDRHRFRPYAQNSHWPITLQGGRALNRCLWAWISWQSRADCLLSKWNSYSEIPTALLWASVSVRKPPKFLSVAGFVSCVTQVEPWQTFVVFPPYQGFWATGAAAAAPVSQHHRCDWPPLGMRLMLALLLHTHYFCAVTKVFVLNLNMRSISYCTLGEGNNVERTQTCRSWGMIRNSSSARFYLVFTFIVKALHFLFSLLKRNFVASCYSFLPRFVYITTGVIYSWPKHSSLRLS